MGLRRYQAEDLHKWANELNCRGALYWEPGLGKTYVTSLLLKRMIDIHKTEKVLIIVPATLVSMWVEALSGLGLADITFQFRPKNKIKKGESALPGSDKSIHVISYHMFMQVYEDDGLFLSMGYDFWILDESHNIKNHSSKVFTLLSYFNRPELKIMLLSGTPFPQGRIDVFSQLSLLAPGCVGKNITAFRKRYCTLKNEDFWTYAILSHKEKEIDDILYKYCCFREADTEVEIPPMTTIDIEYSLTTAQRNLYNMVKNKKVIAYKNEETGELVEIPVALPAVRMLLCQQIASGVVDLKINDPLLSADQIKLNFQIEKTPNEKEELLIDLLSNLPRDRQALVWINYKKTGYRLLELLRKNLPDRVIEVINSDVTDVKRDNILKAYEAKKVDFIIAHPKTIGTGFNYFTKTQYSYWYEGTTDYAVYEQARRRLKRIGQEHKTFEYNLIGKNTIDKYIVEAIRLKKDVLEYIFENYFKDDTLESEN